MFVNIIYHMENQHLDRYVGNYDKFEEVYAVKGTAEGGIPQTAAGDQ